jgi:predicted acetyltransferase
MYEYNPKSDYSKESIEAFFFPENFKSIQLPQKYVSMVGYADCLIGTETLKLKDEVEEGWVDLPENWISLSEKKKEKLLDEMRSTRVIGQCSQDDSPREHAANIALLSAETNNWEVFIKAHLDILNDRFDRMSDGSYAWNQRKTYIREIEDLNIDVENLILGISLRIENPENNHYYGSIGRIGRALAESKNRKEIEQEMLLIISDTELDLLNRLLIYFLYVNCNNYLSDEAIKQENRERLKEVVQSFPGFIRDQLLEN